MMRAISGRQVGLVRTGMYLLSRDKADAKKVETMSFRDNTVKNFTKIAHEPEKRLQFVEGRCLIYRSSRGWLTALKQSSIYLVPFSGIAYLIYANPFAQFFPAAVPILAFIDFIILKLWHNQIKRNENIVSEIYLLDNGEATEVHFANRLKRQLFGQETKKLYYNSVFANPDLNDEDIVMVDKQNRLFPSSEEEAARQVGEFPWRKFYSNGENFLLVPRQAQHMNLPVLVQIFQGKVIRNKIN